MHVKGKPAVCCRHGTQGAAQEMVACRNAEVQQHCLQRFTTAVDFNAGFNMFVRHWLPWCFNGQACGQQRLKCSSPACIHYKKCLGLLQGLTCTVWAGACTVWADGSATM